MPGMPGDNPSIILLPTFMADVKEPAKCALLWDDSVYPQYSGLYGARSARFEYTKLLGRHNEGDNFGFVDGHAKWYRTKGILVEWPTECASALPCGPCYIYPPDATPDTAAMWTVPYYSADYEDLPGGCYPYYYSMAISHCR